MSSDSICRVNYFDGEALLTADFKDEQQYHVQMRELLSQGLLTPGILQGLEVDWTSPASHVTVRSGSALDSLGRLIVLAKDASYAPTPLAPGQPNYVTVHFHEDPDQPQHVGENKRWIQNPSFSCDASYDPNGAGILLAVVTATASGEIQGVAYSSNTYWRSHVGATFQSMQFVDERNSLPWPAASAAMNQETLEITAPNIDLNGPVTASGNFSGTFDGTFNGVYTGDGTRLTLPPQTNYWERDPDHNLYYDRGKVTVGDTTPSSAYLTVRQGRTPPLVAAGLISLHDDGCTVFGYQTQFMSQVKVGDALIYDYAPEQSATIVRLIGRRQLEIRERFPIDLGPSAYHTQHSGDPAVAGRGTVSACGTIVTCTDDLPTNLAEGDKIILDASKEDSPASLRVQSVDSDTQLTIATVSGGAKQGGPKLSSFSVAPSVLLEVGGSSAGSPTLVPAMVIAQNGGGVTPPNSVAINKSAPDRNYALDISGPVLLEDDVHLNKSMEVAGDLTVDGDLDVKNGLTVNHTTHQVTAENNMQVVGALTVGGTLDVPTGKTTLQSLEVTQDMKIDGTLTVGSLAGFSVPYLGTRKYSAYFCPPDSPNYTAVSGETAQSDGILTVCLNTIAMTCDAGFAGALAVTFTGADATMDNYLAIWSSGTVVPSLVPIAAQPKTLSIPLRKDDKYTIAFSSNGTKYSGISINVLWTSFGT
jgi:hypothetical protein